MLWAVRKFPVCRHPVETEGIEQRDECFTLRVNGRKCSVERVAIIERNKRAIRFQPDRTHQRCDSGVTSEDRICCLPTLPNKLMVRLKIPVSVVDL